MISSSSLLQYLVTYYSYIYYRYRDQHFCDPKHGFRWNMKKLEDEKQKQIVVCPVVLGQNTRNLTLSLPKSGSLEEVDHDWWKNMSFWKRTSIQVLIFHWFSMDCWHMFIWQKMANLDGKPLKSHLTLCRIFWRESSGQISIIPKPELRGFWGSSLTKPPFRVTSADVVIICPESFQSLWLFHQKTTKKSTCWSLPSCSLRTLLHPGKSSALQSPVTKSHLTKWYHRKVTIVSFKRSRTQIALSQKFVGCFGVFVAFFCSAKRKDAKNRVKKQQRKRKKQDARGIKNRFEHGFWWSNLTNYSSSKRKFLFPPFSFPVNPINPSWRISHVTRFQRLWLWCFYDPKKRGWVVVIFAWICCCRSIHLRLRGRNWSLFGGFFEGCQSFKAVFASKIRLCPTRYHWGFIESGPQWFWISLKTGITFPSSKVIGTQVVSFDGFFPCRKWLMLYPSADFLWIFMIAVTYFLGIILMFFLST